MREKMVSNSRKLDNRGSITVLVLVAIMFLTILGMTMLTMTALNVQMRAVNTKSQGNFYNTDSILDEIKAGLAQTSSEVTKEAYTEVLENYIVISKTATMQQAFDEYYINKLVRRLAGETTPGSVIPESEDIPATGVVYRYAENMIKGYLTASDPAVQEEKQRTVQYILDDAVIDVCPSGERYITLKNIKIRKKENGFETILSTDIRMEIPALSFSRESLYPEYTRYALIADDQIRVDGTSGIVVNGNLYAGTVKRNVNDSSTNPTAGLVVKDSGSISVVGDSVITRGDILLSNNGGASFGVFSGLQCNVWAQNILLEQNSLTGGSSLEIHGKTYVEDDLEMNGMGSSVELSGSYYGYHCKQNYDAGEAPATESKYSSAIQINGRENTLNMSGLADLVIAGRTFISRGDAAKNKDILTGESLTVKSNQMAYYVPGYFISDKEKKDSKAYTFEDGEKFYFDIAGYENYVEFDIKEYLHATNPITRYYLQESGSNICYYYLNFKDQEAAVDFQELFYKTKKNSLDGSAENYLSKNGITLNSGQKMLLLSGNVLYREGSSTGELDIKIGNSGENTSFFDSYGTTYGRAYKARQLGLVSNLSEGYSGAVRLTEAEQAIVKNASGVESPLNDVNSLFYRLVDVEKLKAEASSSPIAPEKIVSESGTELGVVWLVNGDFTFDSAKATQGATGIIIATGKVTLNANFDGLIVSGDDIVLRICT